MDPKMEHPVNFNRGNSVDPDFLNYFMDNFEELNATYGLDQPFVLPPSRPRTLPSLESESLEPFPQLPVEGDIENDNTNVDEDTNLAINLDILESTENDYDADADDELTPHTPMSDSSDTLDNDSSSSDSDSDDEPIVVSCRKRRRQRRVVVVEDEDEDVKEDVKDTTPMKKSRSNSWVSVSHSSVSSDSDSDSDSDCAPHIEPEKLAQLVDASRDVILHAIGISPSKPVSSSSLPTLSHGQPHMFNWTTAKAYVAAPGKTLPPSSEHGTVGAPTSFPHFSGSTTSRDVDTVEAQVPFVDYYPSEDLDVADVAYERNLEDEVRVMEKFQDMFPGQDLSNKKGLVPPTESFCMSTLAQDVNSTSRMSEDALRLHPHVLDSLQADDHLLVHTVPWSKKTGQYLGEAAFGAWKEEHPAPKTGRNKGKLSKRFEDFVPKIPGVTCEFTRGHTSEEYDYAQLLDPEWEQDTAASLYKKLTRANLKASLAKTSQSSRSSRSSSRSTSSPAPSTYFSSSSRSHSRSSSNASSSSSSHSSSTSNSSLTAAPTPDQMSKPYLSYHGVTLTNEDVHVLRSDWLTDNNITFWQEYLEHEVLPKYPQARIVLLRASFLMLLASANREVARQALPNFKDVTHVFIPISDAADPRNRQGNEGSHWSLLLISITDGVAFHYDSMGANNLIAARSVTSRLAVVLNQPLRFRNIDDTPQQGNSIDCGVYVCVLMRFLLVKRLLNAHAREKVSMSLGGKMIDAQGGRQEMLRIIENLRREGERRRSASPFAKKEVPRID